VQRGRIKIALDVLEELSARFILRPINAATEKQP